MNVFGEGSFVGKALPYFSPRSRKYHNGPMTMIQSVPNGEVQSDGDPKPGKSSPTYYFVRQFSSMLLWMTGMLLAFSGMLLESPRCVKFGGFVLVAGLISALFLKSMANYRFTLWILIANFSAMLVPDWFRSINGFSLTDPWLLLVLLQLIMFGMGTQMSVQDFLNVARMPRAIIIGVSCQFLIMPLLGYTLAKAFNFPMEIGAGLILVGSCPSGIASNVMTFLAKGNLALSVTLTAIITVLAPVVTPLWMRVLAGSMIEVDAVKMSLDIVKMVLIPILAAFVDDFLGSSKAKLRRTVWATCVVSLVWLTWFLWFGWSMLQPTEEISTELSWHLAVLLCFVAGSVVFGCVYNVVTRLLPKLKDWMPRLSMAGIIYFTLVATAQGRDQLLAVGLMLLVAATLHNVLGLTLGYWMSRSLGMSRQDARTISIEVGSQNAAMATGLAKGMGKLGTVGLACVMFAPIMNITGSLVANYWRKRPVS